ncbi:hypothetical protein TRIUR3_29413 [Triticum urartu]|uniref:Uncharacterized protein n=1 Tax=Triticum urartu TaxID=4572 RepID=M7ZP44_TRIUA|nr:hypothetical protein TRIUR3_29413 [Triticum urartu]
MLSLHRRMCLCIFRRLPLLQEISATVPIGSRCRQPVVQRNAAARLDLGRPARAQAAARLHASALQVSGWTRPRPPLASHAQQSVGSSARSGSLAAASQRPAASLIESSLYGSSKKIHGRVTITQLVDLRTAGRPAGSNWVQVMPGIEHTKDEGGARQARAVHVSL